MVGEGKEWRCWIQHVTVFYNLHMKLIEGKERNCSGLHVTIYSLFQASIYSLCEADWRERMKLFRSACHYIQPIWSHYIRSVWNWRKGKNEAVQICMSLYTAYLKPLYTVCVKLIEGNGWSCSGLHVVNSIACLKLSWKDEAVQVCMLLYTVYLKLIEGHHSSGAVWESKWPSWAVRPNEPSGFRGRKAILNHASAFVPNMSTDIRGH